VLRNASGGFELHTYDDPRVATIAGAFATSFASAQDESGNVFLAVLDQWGALLLARFNAATDTWSAWTKFGGVFRGAPAIVAGGNSALLAIRDSHSAYWTMTVNTELTVSNLTNVGGIFQTDPALAADWSLSAAYVVGKDFWNALWSLNLQVPYPVGGWTPMGGVVKGKPAVAVGLNRIAYVAARDLWDGLWVSRMSGTMLLNWGFLGGILSQDPLISNLENGSLAVAVRDPGSALWSAVIPETEVHSPPVWTPYNGVVESYGPAAHDTVLYFAARDAWNNLWWVRSTDGRWTFVDVGGRARGNPSASP
jgi:hypothetical protein